MAATIDLTALLADAGHTLALPPEEPAHTGLSEAEVATTKGFIHRICWRGYNSPIAWRPCKARWRSVTARCRHRWCSTAAGCIFAVSGATNSVLPTASSNGWPCHRPGRPAISGRENLIHSPQHAVPIHRTGGLPETGLRPGCPEPLCRDYRRPGYRQDHHRGGCWRPCRRWPGKPGTGRAQVPYPPGRAHRQGRRPPERIHWRRRRLPLADLPGSVQLDDIPTRSPHCTGC